jgi:hypothetical protein
MLPGNLELTRSCLEKGLSRHVLCLGNVLGAYI